MIKVYNEGVATAKVEIFTAIGETFLSGEEVQGGFTLAKMKAALTNIDPEQIIVDISSPGGDLHEALAVHDVLKNYNARVVTNIVGPSASAATVISAAGDYRTISENATYQIHQVQSLTAGDADDHEKAADQLKKYDNIIAGLYQKISGKKRNDIKRLMKEDRPLTAEEAMEWGFVNEIIHPKISNMAKDEENKKNEKEDEIEDLKNKLKAAQDEIEDLKNKLKNEDKEDEEDEMEALRAKVKSYEEKEEEEKEQAKKNKAEAIVAMAQERGVCDDSEKQAIFNLALTNPEEAEKVVGLIRPSLAAMIKPQNGKDEMSPEDRQRYLQVWNTAAGKGRLAALQTENPEEYKLAYFARFGKKLA